VRNIFLLYMPPSNYEAMMHYQDTIVSRVPLERLSPFLPRDLVARLRGVFGRKPIAVWGSREGPKNRSNFEMMALGDDILIVEGRTVRLIGKVAAKTVNAGLARELWKPLRQGDDTPWELVYFIANPREVNVPFDQVGALFDYSANYHLRGFTTVAAGRLVSFYEKYDDLYSILERMQGGEPVRAKDPAAETPGTSAPEAEPGMAGHGTREGPQEERVSEHVLMQWKLARLGLKAGERVWVPANDQARLRKHYSFEECDPEFAAGIDLPHSYVENIDVVWKQEFRIGAAYEIEHSTSIYSGLLRFADLNILAPNTLYPMFIVAPGERRNQVREQLRRPAFTRLGLNNKVRFLSYEKVDEIDAFFTESSAGLSVDTVVAKSELVGV
jgi:hypothetical protein